MGYIMRTCLNPTRKKKKEIGAGVKLGTRALALTWVLSSIPETNKTDKSITDDREYKQTQKSVIHINTCIHEPLIDTTNQAERKHKLRKKMCLSL